MLADADDNGDGLANDGFGGDPWYSWLLMAGGTTRRCLLTRIDRGHCAPSVSPGTPIACGFVIGSPELTAIVDSAVVWRSRLAPLP